MKQGDCKSSDPDIINSFKALKRAARQARELSIRTGTPFWVMQDGKIVDLNRKTTSKTAPRRGAAARKK